MRVLSALLPTAIAVCAWATLTTPARAQIGWEWEPDEGYHREEWYDPSDWFDDDSTVDYEFDYYDWSAWDDDWDYGDWYDDEWYDDYGWDDYDYWGSDYGYWGYYDPGYDPYGYDYYEEGFYEEDLYDYPGYYDSYEDDWFYLDEDDWVWSSERDEWVQWSELQDESSTGRSGDQGSYDDQVASGSQRYSDEAQGSGNRRRQQLASLHGTVDSFATVKLQGEREEHTVLRIQLEDGSQRLVNLGPNPQLEQLRLRPGAAIMVEGRLGHISDKRVLMATRIRVAQTMDAMSMDMVAIRGEIGDWRKMKLGNGDRRDHLLVRLKLENGRTAVVNLGPNASLAELGLEQGDHLMIRGTKRQVSGRKVVFVRSLRIEQEPIQLDWSPSRGQRGEAASPSR